MSTSTTYSSIAGGGEVVAELGGAAVSRVRGVQRQALDQLGLGLDVGQQAAPGPRPRVRPRPDAEHLDAAVLVAHHQQLHLAPVIEHHLGLAWVHGVESPHHGLLSLLTVPEGDQRLGVEPGGAVDHASVLVAGQRGLAAAEGVRPAHAALIRGPGQQPLLGRVPGQAHHLRLLGPHRPYAKLVPAVARPPDPEFEVMKLHIQKKET